MCKALLIVGTNFPNILWLLFSLFWSTLTRSVLDITIDLLQSWSRIWSWILFSFSRHSSEAGAVSGVGVGGTRTGGAGGLGAGAGRGRGGITWGGESIWVLVKGRPDISPGKLCLSKRCNNSSINMSCLSCLSSSSSLAGPLHQAGPLNLELRPKCYSANVVSLGILLCAPGF